jgi:anti-sigma regulatory factor (Ser/Thr protein kinase)
MTGVTAIPTVRGERDARFRLKAVPEAAAQARALVEATLIDWRFHSLIEDAKLLVSELASNSIAATPGEELWLLLALQRSHVWICVWDSSPILPPKPAHRPESETGRGLRIVAAVADDNGAFLVAEPAGKIVWTRLKT